jgi:UDP-N-acetylmuramate: L-alanyl-gamma-D-glutamyl-meso-diaminopimelate ligase
MQTGFAVKLGGVAQGRVERFDLAGTHNRANALAALAAARHAGVPVAVGLEALESVSRSQAPPRGTRNGARRNRVSTTSPTIRRRSG